jgi:general secretion pathway protein D
MPSLRTLSLTVLLCLTLSVPLTLPAQAPPMEGGPPAEMATDSGGESSSGNASRNSRTGTNYSSENLGQTPTTDAIIQYDQETDSIIVITDDLTNNQIKHVIETMDKPIPQVLIKVLFLEVTHSNDLNLGAEASFSWDSKGGTNRSSIGSDFGIASATNGGFLRILDEDLQMTLHALATVGKLNVLSRPSIMTRNNQQATITVGQEIPFITNSRVTDSGQTINTIRYDDIGIILEVTPHITAERLVQLDVAPEISTLTADTVPISDTADARVIAKRSADTSVVVADAKTVVIGGLMQDTLTESVEKIPMLGDIPWLGTLFSYTKREKEKTELLIFLTPYVVDTPAQSQALSVQENNKADVPPKEFTPRQQEKFRENMGPGARDWTAKP